MLGCCRTALSSWHFIFVKGSAAERFNSFGFLPVKTLQLSLAIHSAEKTKLCL